MVVPSFLLLIITVTTLLATICANLRIGIKPMIDEGFRAIKIHCNQSALEEEAHPAAADQDRLIGKGRQEADQADADVQLNNGWEEKCRGADNVLISIEWNGCEAEAEFYVDLPKLLENDHISVDIGTEDGKMVKLFTELEKHGNVIYSSHLYAAIFYCYSANNNGQDNASKTDWGTNTHHKIGQNANKLILFGTIPVFAANAYVSYGTVANLVELRNCIDGAVHIDVLRRGKVEKQMNMPIAEFEFHLNQGWMQL